MCFDAGFYGNALMQKRIMTAMLGEDVPAIWVDVANLAVSLVAFVFLAATLALLGSRALDVVQLQVVGFYLNAAIAATMALCWAPLTAQPTDRASTVWLLLLYVCLYGTCLLPKLPTLTLASARTLAHTLILTLALTLALTLTLTLTQARTGFPR